MAFGPPPYITSGGLERARRRRRWRTVLGGLVVLVAAGLAVFAVQGGFGRGGRGSRYARAQGSGRRLASAGSLPLAGSRRARGPQHSSLTAVIARGNAEIRRLIPLGLPVYCAGPHGHDVAFTFDDGPGVYTYLALRKLRQAHERATFFVVGKSMHSWPGYLGRELKLAAIGDHTYTHPDLVTLSPAEVKFQLARTAQMIHEQSGEAVDLWRPPYGAYNKTVIRIAQHLRLLEILWSTDSADSLGASWAGIIKTAEAGLRPGAIILFHENRGQTIRAMTTLLSYLHRRHFASVSIPELFAADPPSVAQLRRGLDGCLGQGQLIRHVG